MPIPIDSTASPPEALPRARKARRRKRVDFEAMVARSDADARKRAHWHLVKFDNELNGAYGGYYARDDYAAYSEVPHPPVFTRRGKRVRGKP